MGFAQQEYLVNISLETTQTNSMAQLNIPTWIMFAVILVGISILPNTLTTEKEKKTLDAILVSPASEKDVIYGKAAFGLFLTLTMSLLILFINDGFIGNVPVVLLFIFLGSTAFTGLGLLIASYADNHSSASAISTILMIPLLLLALLADLSKEIETISYFVPSTYMLNGIKDAMFSNKGIQDVYLDLLVLIIFNVMVYILTIYVLQKRKNHLS
jgi:ABC-2 type transport system permease protein